MLIEEKLLNYWIENFYGYGSWKARFWFVGYEESGGDAPEEVAEKINYLYTTGATSSGPTLCDIRELYQQVAFRIDGPRAKKFTTFHDHRFGQQATLHGAWKNLIAFVHGYQARELPDLLTYQQHSFAAPSAQTEALIQLYPLPAHNHAWYYAWLDLPQLPFLKSRTLYQDYLYPTRIRTILENTRAYKPEVVLMYGMENINGLKESICQFFPSATFKMVKAIKQHIPQHHRADVNGTTLLLTTQIPALRHNRIESGFDWHAFGELVKGG
ncbi:MAG: hypothetical protein KF803_13710 [Cyclobacteriaceae bacterium]|nr:hypothetical protein [Cyclobacteriaceae bacterium]